MSATKLCERYLDAIRRNDLDAVLSLFAPGAVVASPIYGVRPAEAYYARLFADTQASETTLLAVFEGTDETPRLALHFRYRWRLAAGGAAAFDVVDLFALTPDRRQFAGLTIVYDTTVVRRVFNEPRRSSNHGIDVV
jgi:hypothetical protein